MLERTLRLRIAKNALRLRVTCEEIMTRHAELVHRSLGVGGLVEAYPVPRSNIPFDFGSQKHSPAQGDD